MASPLDISVIASKDDAWRRNDASFYSDTADTLCLGCTSTGTHMHSGVRFQDVTIPNGATITTAHITFVAHDSDTGTVAEQIIAAEQTATAAAFSSAADFDTRMGNLTTATVSWTPSSWSAGTGYDTTDIKTIVQELVNDYNGLNLADIVFFIMDNGTTGSSNHRFPYAYDHAGGTPAALHIEYTEASGWANVTKIHGVASSSISKVNGVAVASISKVNGVAV